MQGHDERIGPRDAEELFRVALEGSPVTVFATDEELRYTWAFNPALELTPKDVIGKTDVDLLGEGEARTLTELKRRVLETGAPAGEEVAISSRGPTRWYYVALHPRRGAGGRITGIVGAAVDVTERIKVDSARRESEEKLRLLMSSLPACISYVDSDLRYRFNNATYGKWFGVAEAELEGRTVKEVLGAAAFARIRPHIEAVLAGARVSFEDRIPYDGAGTRDVEVDYVPHREGEEVVGFFALIRDVTARRQTEEALRRVTAKLIDAQEQERRSVARELHDDLAQDLVLLAMSSGDPQTLSDQIAAMSERIRSISHRLHPAVLEQLGLVAALRSECFSGSRQGIEVELSAAGELDDVPWDVSLCLYRIAQEALKNAIQHGKATRARIELTEEAEGIRLSVRDWGVGFDREAARKAAGLGLVSMEERVRLLKGRIRVDSTPGSGTFLTVWIPCSARKDRKTA